MLKIPCIPHRRMNITQVKLIRTGQYALCHCMAAGDHEDVVGKVKLLYGKRHQR